MTKVREWEICPLLLKFYNITPTLSFGHDGDEKGEESWGGKVIIICKLIYLDEGNSCHTKH